MNSIPIIHSQKQNGKRAGKQRESKMRANERVTEQENRRTREENKRIKEPENKLTLLLLGVHLFL